MCFGHIHIKLILSDFIIYVYLISVTVQKKQNDEIVWYSRMINEGTSSFTIH